MIVVYGSRSGSLGTGGHETGQNAAMKGSEHFSFTASCCGTGGAASAEESNSEEDAAINSSSYPLMSLSRNDDALGTLAFAYMISEGWFTAFIIPIKA